VNFPHPEKRTNVQTEYAKEFSTQDAIDHVVRSANKTLVLISGGSKSSDDVMLGRAREAMEAGATGFIFGRNVWQREHDESLRFASRLHEILASYPS
jgi:class I fructose-bisphosphate aldolase